MLRTVAGALLWDAPVPMTDVASGLPYATISVPGRDMGLKKVMVTHAEFPSQNLTGDEQKELADLGAIIEHCFTTTYTGKAPWETAFANIRKTGVSRTLIATDLGQTLNPPVAEGFAMFAQRLLDAGFSVEDVRTMAVTNPTRLVEE